MAKGYTKRLPNFGPLNFWRALVRREHKEKIDKNFTFVEELARIDYHRRLKLAHSAYHQGLRARPGDHPSRKTTRLSNYVERHHRTHKPAYPSGRSKDLAERSAIIGATEPVVIRHEEARAGEGG